MRKRVMFLFVIIVVLAVAACAGRQKNILETNESQVKLRSMQSRVFDITDHNLLLRIIIATFQDLGFVIDDAEETLGTVSGTKLSGYALRMTVSIRPRGTQQMIVRSSLQYNLQTIEDPEPYQYFLDGPVPYRTFYCQEKGPISALLQCILLSDCAETADYRGKISHSSFP